jgi:hypothetical protein
MVLHLERLSTTRLLYAADKHQWRKINRDETIGYNSKDSGAEKGCHYPFYYISY